MFTITSGWDAGHRVAARHNGNAEIIYKINPDLIIKTGVARGNSSVFYASMMKLLGTTGSSRDIDIRPHNYVKLQTTRFLVISN